MSSNRRSTRECQFRDLTAIRRERAQAQQVAIFQVGRKSVIVRERPERVEARIAELERLNPGCKFETR